MKLSPELIVVGLGILLALWYLGASVFNRRRGVTIFRWLHDSLETFGGEVASRWIGSSGSGAEIKIHKPHPPFKQVDLIYLLASRELLPLFLLDLARGKRDRLIVKLTMRSAFYGEVEVVNASSKQAVEMRTETDKPWTVEEGPANLLIGSRGRDTEAARAALVPFLEKYGENVRSVSWSRKAPHVILILSLSGLYATGDSAQPLYEALEALAAGQKKAE